MAAARVYQPVPLHRTTTASSRSSAAPLPLRLARSPSAAQHVLLLPSCPQPALCGSPLISPCCRSLPASSRRQRSSVGSSLHASAAGAHQYLSTRLLISLHRAHGPSSALPRPFKTSRWDWHVIVGRVCKFPGKPGTPFPPRNKTLIRTSPKRAAQHKPRVLQWIVHLYNKSIRGAHKLLLGILRDNSALRRMRSAHTPQTCCIRRPIPSLRVSQECLQSLTSHLPCRDRIISWLSLITRGT